MLKEKISFSIEDTFKKLIFYNDSNTNNTYVCFNVDYLDKKSKKWYDECKKHFTLDELINEFGYKKINLSIENNNICVSWDKEKQDNLNVLLTNIFYVDFLKYNNQNSIDNVAYNINFKRLYKNQEPKQKEISYDNKLNEIIMNKQEEGITLDNDKLPERVEIQPIPKGFHPNKDENGKYMTGPVNHIRPYESLYNPYQYNYNNTITNSYIPTFNTFDYNMLNNNRQQPQQQQSATVTLNNPIMI